MTGASSAGRTCTIRSSRVPTSSSQPTPQYGQVVRVDRCGRPSDGERPVLERARRAASAHAPQLTHELWPSGAPASGTSRIAPPRSDHVPRVLALQVATDPLAQEAVDALRHVDADVRVRVVDPRRIGGGHGARRRAPYARERVDAADCRRARSAGRRSASMVEDLAAPGLEPAASRVVDDHARRRSAWCTQAPAAVHPGPRRGTAGRLRPARPARRGTGAAGARLRARRRPRIERPTSSSTRRPSIVIRMCKVLASHVQGPDRRDERACDVCPRAVSAPRSRRMVSNEIEVPRNTKLCDESRVV